MGCLQLMRRGHLPLFIQNPCKNTFADTPWGVSPRRFHVHSTWQWDPMSLVHIDLRRFSWNLWMNVNYLNSYPWGCGWGEGWFRVQQFNMQLWRLEFRSQHPHSKPGILQTHIYPALREGHLLLASMPAQCVHLQTQVCIHFAMHNQTSIFAFICKSVLFPSVPCSASLVPVFSFGENDLYKQINNPKGSWLRTIQDAMYDSMGVALPLIYARGIFQHYFGIMPYRKLIYTVGMYWNTQKILLRTVFTITGEVLIFQKVHSWV